MTARLTRTIGIVILLASAGVFAEEVRPARPPKVKLYHGRGRKGVEMNEGRRIILDELAPQLVLYQAGVDPLDGDVLGSLRLTKQGLRERDEFVMSECRSRSIPIAVTLGGGYAADTDDTIDAHFNTCQALCETWSQ